MHACSKITRYSGESNTYLVVSAVCLWNLLPQDVVRASGLEAFKGGLDKFLEEKSITGDKP